MGRYPADSAASVVHRSWRRGVALSSLPQPVEDNTSQNDEEHETEGDGQADEDDEAESQITACNICQRLR